MFDSINHKDFAYIMNREPEPHLNVATIKCDAEYTHIKQFFWVLTLKQNASIHHNTLHFLFIVQSLLAREGT